MNTPVAQLLQAKGHTVYSIGPDDWVYDAVKEMDARRIGSLLVKDAAGHPVGIVTERDCRHLLLQDRSARKVRVSELMSRNLLTVPPEETVEQCMQMMTEKRIRHLPVVRGGAVQGIISIGDVVKFLCIERGIEIENLEKYITGTM
jgi:CBS domain-containing protein